MTTPPAPIYKLTHDALYHIFSFNANLFDHKDHRLPHGSPQRALTTTRYTSQVCREWHSIVLNSTTLWARLIDLDLLQQEKDDWRDEILRRAGDAAMLWIRNTRMAMMDGMPLPVEAFLLRLLDEFWNRVQILDIFVEDWAALAAKGNQLCLRPAPSLQNFTVEMSTYGGASVTPPNAPILRLFADSAPSIKVFCAPKMPLDLQTSWLSHLRKLTMFMPHDLKPLFDAFTVMPFLESIDIVTPENSSIDFENEASFSYERQISLPRLELLAIQHSLRTCYAFVEHIIPKEGCSLHLEASYSSVAPVTQGLLSSDRQALSSLFHKWLACNQGADLQIRLKNQGATMQVYSFPQSRESCFFFGITCEDGLLDNDNDLHHLLSPFKSPVPTSSHLGNIKHLTLKIMISPSPTHSTLFPLFDFLSCLSAVESLQATSSTLVTYCQRRTAEFLNLFPSLRELVFEVHNGNGPFSGLDIRNGVPQFLSERDGKIENVVIKSQVDISEEDIRSLTESDLKTFARKVTWTQNGQIVEHQF